MNKFILTIITVTISLSNYLPAVEIQTIKNLWSGIYDVSINDEGCVVGRNTNEIYTWDLGVETLKVPNRFGAHLNNLSDMLYGSDKEIYIHNRNSGKTDKVNILDSNYVVYRGFNNHKQIIGYYCNSTKSGSFLWDNGQAVHLGLESHLACIIESEGYHLTDLTVLAINDHGYYAGFFGVGKYNKLAKGWVTTKFKPFFWDGSIHIGKDINEFPSGQLSLELTNTNLILVHNNPHSFIWDTNSDTYTEFCKHFCTLEHYFQWNYHYHLFGRKTITDNGVVIGYLPINSPVGDYTNGMPCLWNGNRVVGLNEILNQDHKKLAPPFNDDYEVEKITSICGINNRNQIAGLGTTWGVTVPVVIHLDLEENEIGEIATP